MHVITSHVIPVNRAHVDTDLIIPAEFLSTVTKQGLGQHLFAGIRAREADFVFNQPRYQHAKILVAGINFGCGSSREHAVWAMTDWGIRVVIAPSFADIFHQNALNNQMLPIVLSAAQVEQIFAKQKGSAHYILTVDLPNQSVTTPSGEVFGFQIDPYKKECLMHGMDDLNYLLSKRPQIKAFEQRTACHRFFNTAQMHQLINGEA
jgi:3-isopropylmalate/(R)-2-methylmalate dehydratase small subunit